jgi:hypothetical protein
MYKIAKFSCVREELDERHSSDRRGFGPEGRRNPIPRLRRGALTPAVHRRFVRRAPQAVVVYYWRTYYKAVRVAAERDLRCGPTSRVRRRPGSSFPGTFVFYLVWVSVCVVASLCWLLEAAGRRAGRGCRGAETGVC